MFFLTGMAVFPESFLKFSYHCSCLSGTPHRFGKGLPRPSLIAPTSAIGSVQSFPVILILRVDEISVIQTLDLRLQTSD